MTTADPVPAADKPIVVYDGACGYCLKQLARMRRLDRQQRFAYVARQTDGLTDSYPVLGEGDFNTGMRLLEVDGRLYVGADAVYQIARRLDGARWIAWIYRVPVLRSICRATYAWIARNRYRLAGTCEPDGACRVPERGDGL